MLQVDNPKTAAANLDLFDNVKQRCSQMPLTLSLSMILALAIMTTPSTALAADFAGKDISGQDFSNQDLSGKDFTKVVAKKTNFAGSTLQGANFAGANLVQADFSGADVQKANFFDAALDGTIFKDVNAQRSTYGKTILDVGDFENADLSNYIYPSTFRVMICDMDELKGVNKVTGADTRGSAMCNSELKFSN